MKKHIWVMLLLSGAMLISTFISAESQSAKGFSVEISRLDFENADIRQVIKTLSEIGDRNIILDKSIEGECTIFLKDITWESALIAVLNMNDLVGYEDNGLIKVLPRTSYEKQIDDLEEKIKNEKMQKRLIEPEQVRVIKIHNARAEDIKETLDPLLGEQDKPSVDLRTNSLVFTASDSSLAVIEDIVKDLDTETKQVSIEVKMVTVDSGSLTEIGVNWSAIKEGNSGEQSTIAIDDEDQSKLLVGKYSGTISNVALEMALATLIDTNKGEIVSRPHVTTQDNEPAVIQSGQQIPKLTYDEARNLVTEMIDATTRLQVTPHILTDDRILLDVHAQRRSGEAVGMGVTINEEVADVKMITSNGETAVIGGLRQMNDSKRESGIPILQDVPLIGQLFKYTKIETIKKDLIIFITPNIVESVSSHNLEKSDN
ncbi:MAG: hypothetical protein JXB48_21810 [Candidatus Latescibacteria bacterium]|nr:hypothetical protein [Candidatus Latescibacterota bacterium]